MKALVLGGGSLKGAWQAGAIQAVLDSGFEPDMIYGISAGALNSSFLVNETGKQIQKTGKIDWQVANKKLISFWIENIRQPSDIGVLQSRFKLGINTILSRFDGLLDTAPLHDKLKKHIHLDSLRSSTIQLKIGTVNINTGQMKYVDPSEKHFMDFLMASSSLPIIMPTVQIGGDHREAYSDGGLREVLPLKKAIEDGAKEIYAIATHPKHRQLEHINHRSFFALIERIKDISVNQFENNDISWAKNYNKRIVSIAGYSINKKIDLQVIRPKEPIIIKLTDFNSNDIKEVIKQGYQYAYTTLNKK